MGKVLEDSLGNLEYLLLGLTFLGVLYLVMKQANLSVSVDRKEGATGASHKLRFDTEEDDRASRSGFGSMSGNEAPTFHQVAFNPDAGETTVVWDENAKQAVTVPLLSLSELERNSAMTEFNSNTILSGERRTFEARRFNEGMRNKNVGSSKAYEGMDEMVAAANGMNVSQNRR